jgi:hypothetical protein
MSEREKLKAKPPKCPKCGKRKYSEYVPKMFTAIKDWRTT